MNRERRWIGTDKEKQTAYTFAIPNLPVQTLFNRIFRRRMLKAATNMLNGLDGLTGITFNPPQGTLLHFATLNQAKIARNRLESDGINCGVNIMESELDEETGAAYIKEKAD